MAQILSLFDFQKADDMQAFKEITSPSFDVDTCPRGNKSTFHVLEPCKSCPLLEVCSDECGMNDANGYY